MHLTSLFKRVPFISNSRFGGRPVAATLAIVLAAQATAAAEIRPNDAASSLRAGLAKIDITPTQPVLLAGYASRTNLSQGVHDPLSARAVAFDQDGKRLVLVSLDNLGFYNRTAEPMRQAILESCQLRPEELFLCAIHTHSAPLLTLNAEKDHPNNVGYAKVLQGKLVDVVRQALDRLAPVRIGIGSGYSPVGANRREPVRGSESTTRIVLGRNPSAPIDREVQVLKITRPEGNELLGVAFDFATHSTSLGPGNLLVSGDVHGLAEQFVEAHFGAGLVAPALAGASGNIDPWYRVLPGFNTNNGWIPEPVLLGTLLGEEVALVARRIQAPITHAPIRTMMKTIDLPGKPRGDAASSATNQPAPFVLTVGSIGDIALVGLGGEVFNEIGLAIKAGSPFPYTIVITHCNAAGGYLPTRSSYAEGGYEVQSSSFAPGAAERVIEEATRMLQELHKANP
jgi:neutral ceramidase